MNAHVDPPPVVTDIGKRIEQYIALRDKIAEIKKRHKEELSQFNEFLEKLEGMLLNHLNQLNLDSLKGEAGTAYRTTKKSATIADAAEFRRFVIGSEAWDLADWRANAPAIDDFIKSNQGTPPPGVNYSERFEVGVRRK